MNVPSATTPDTRDPSLSTLVARPLAIAPKYNSGLLFTSVKCLDTCCEGDRMGVQRRKSESEALWRSESEAIAMIVKNDIYFVIFTVLEFVGSLILLNDIMASPL